MALPRPSRKSPRAPRKPSALAFILLGFLVVALVPASAPAAAIKAKSSSGGLLGEIKTVGNWFQDEQNNLTSALHLGGTKSTGPGTPSAAGSLETSVGALTPAQVHHLALAAVKQDPSLSPVDGLIPHTPRVVALEKQRDLNPTAFDGQHPQLGGILSRDEAMRSSVTPLVSQPMAQVPPSAEVISGAALAPSVVPEPGGATMALALIGAVALVGRRPRFRGGFTTEETESTESRS